MYLGVVCLVAIAGSLLQAGCRTVGMEVAAAADVALVEALMILMLSWLEPFHLPSGQKGRRTMEAVNS